MSVQILQGDCREVLKTLAAESVDCIVTSPPYYGLRDYGVAGQIGLEETPDAYVKELVGVFCECRRVLKKSGTLWLNLGDSYGAQKGKGFNTNANTGGTNRVQEMQATYGDIKINKGCKPKDLIGIPWLVAFALRADGWYLRSDIIWSKPNPMPESVTDRPTKAHEYLFLLSKSARYFYDADAIAEIAEPRAYATWDERKASGEPVRRGFNAELRPGNVEGLAPRGGKRNKRSVWEVTTAPFSEAHFATFPPDLIEPCIKAGCPEQVCVACGAPWERVVERTPMVIARSERTHDRGQTKASGTMLSPASSVTLGWQPSCKCDALSQPGVTLDPFGGAGTTALVADRLQRNSIIIELNPEYAAMSERRLNGDAGMFASVQVGEVAFA